MNREDAKRKVLQSTDLVRLIGEQVTLRPKGREFVGLCPFHEDSNPSMYVSPAKQIFKCFACGAGGDAFSFVMDYHKMTFPEAMKYLADREGIALPQSPGRPEHGGGTADLRERMRQANDKAVRFFRKQFADESTGAAAREYVRSRGIGDEMVEAFAIGYAPDAWDALASAVAHHKLDRQAFAATGLIAERSDGSSYDRLRHRLVFPIFDAIGRPIAFGGRILPGSTLDDQSVDAKYLNSPETPLFNKSATLFGLHLAKKPIIDSRTAMIVEGYTDVIAAHQAGLGNVVATLGTALTRQHAAELKRYCDEVILVFDADEAGLKAADRALEVFFTEPVDVKIATLPEGNDPADLLGEADGLDRWNAAMDAAADAMSFHFQRIRTSFDAADTLSGKQRIAEDYLRTLVQLGLKQMEPTRRGMVLSRIAELLKLDLASVDEVARKLGSARRSGGPARDAATGEAAQRPDARTDAEQTIVGCLINHADLFHETMADGRTCDESITADDISHLPTREVFQAVHDWLLHHDKIEATDVRIMLDDEQAVRHAIDVAARAARMCGPDREAALRTLRAEVRYIHDQAARRDLEHAPNNATDGDDLAVRLDRLRELAASSPSAGRIPRIRH